LPAILVVLLLGATLVGPAGAAPRPRGTPAEAWHELDANLAAVAPGVNLLAAEVTDGGCSPVHGLRAERRLAMASVFKLYVLSELARQIEAGEARWDEPLAIQERLKSLPSGAMRDLPAGTSRPLRYYAERMIAESDNTATDHLIARLGRERIEAGLPAVGHGAPELNAPFLLTREVFAFKAAVPAARIDAYLAAPEAEQRRILAVEIDPIRLDRIGWGDWDRPERIDSIEWFASASEVCAVLAALHAMAGRPGLTPVGEILRLNRGGLPDRRDWPRAGHKGGFEAGVYNLTWLLQRDDGRTFVLTAGFNDPAAYVDQARADALVETALRLLADAP
jgi:hypothetical protein